MGLHEIKKSFCTSKEIISKLKRPSTEREKIFTGYTLDKELITRMYRELKKLNSPKVNEPIKEVENLAKQNFSKGRNSNGQNHMKKCLPSLAIKPH
jgi:hypothetical protein